VTVIAFRQGILSADSGVSDDIIICGAKQKVVRRKDGALAAAAGDIHSIDSFFRWFQANFKRGQPEILSDDFDAIVVRPDGSVTFYNQHLVPAQMDGEYFALGTGGDVALGAMAHGASAIDAVRAGIKHTTNCRGPIQALRLDGKVVDFGPKGRG